MSGDLYEHDILEWSQQQAERLRRVSIDEQHADADWPRIIEEIAAVGLALMWQRVRSRSMRHYADDPRTRALPDHCPWSLEALLACDPAPLLAALAGRPLEPTTL